MTDEALLYDHIILVCNGCKGERKYYPVKALTTEELIVWMKTKTEPCPICPSKTCDVKAHIKGQ